MKVLFTTRNSVVSNLIKKVTHEAVSHCAIESHGFIVHSNQHGVLIEPLSKFKKKNQIVDSVDVGKGNKKLLKALSQTHRKGYDIPGLLYLGLKFSLGKIGIKLPKKNLWQTTGMYLCTEFVTHVLDGKENSMITPGQLLNRLKGDSDIDT